MVQVGAYRKGTDPLLDRALEKMAAIEALLHHGLEVWGMADTLGRMGAIAGA
jgi:flagellar biosynthesis/type III secretory pathway ATPase